MKKIKTVGAEASERLQQEQLSRDPIELQQAMQEDYLNNLMQCATDGLKTYKKDFYIIVITKNERLMPNVFRNYFMHRTTCPTPDYDQTVYKYFKKTDEIELIWTIPSQDACHHLKDNAVYVVPEEIALLQFVLDFSDGTLFKICKSLNGEQIDSPLLEEGSYDRKHLHRIN